MPNQSRQARPDFAHGQQRALKHAMRGVTPEALREDAYLRSETKRAVDEAIKALPSLDM